MSVCRLCSKALLAITLYTAAASAAAVFIQGQNVTVRGFDRQGALAFTLSARQELRQFNGAQDRPRSPWRSIDARSRARLQYHHGTIQQEGVALDFQRAEWGAGEVRLYEVFGAFNGEKIRAREARYLIAAQRWQFQAIRYYYPNRLVSRLKAEYQLPLSKGKAEQSPPASPSQKPPANTR